LTLFVGDRQDINTQVDKPAPVIAVGYFKGTQPSGNACGVTLEKRAGG